MKHFILVLILCLLGFTLVAAPVSFDQARMMAGNWADRLSTDFNELAAVVSGEAVIKDGITVAYVFHLQPQGYIIVSAQDYLPPIKLYSLKNNFGQEGKELEELIFNDNKVIIEKVNASVIDPETYFDRCNKMSTRHLLGESFPFSVEDSRVQEVQSLVSTRWWQREPYNLKCPLLNGERCVTGCTATALAQIMKYFRHPAVGRGSRSYTTYTHHLAVSTSFEHPYYWDLMLDTYPTPDTGTAEEQDAVAQLMLDVGVAVNMNYAPDGSGANPSSAISTFPYYFDYSREMRLISRLGRNDAEWFQLAKDQLDHRIPVAFAIFKPDVGHMVVIDGYRITGESPTFHINMGWGGSYDAYYSLNNIVVRDNQQFTVLEWQEYVLNMVPSGWTELPALPFGAESHENKSLLRTDYYCEITWLGASGSASNIDRYVIIRYDGITGERSVLAEIDHTGQIGAYRYSYRLPEFRPDVLIVYAVDYANDWNMIMFCNLMLRE